jgi:chemotaxis protein CheZ
MDMPVRQKVFRIEMMQSGDAARSTPADGAGSTLRHEEVLAELKALRDLVEHRSADAPPARPDQMTAGDLDRLKNETDSIHRAISRTMQEVASLHFGTFSAAGKGRASRELDAVADGTEQATQQILDAVEAVDEAANTLSATLKQEQERALVSDIRDHVVRIFEACNFQDLSGQRIAKVLATLKFVEDRVARMLEIWGGTAAFKDYEAAVLMERERARKLVNGPKLEGDPNHATQGEIDAMFA